MEYKRHRAVLSSTARSGVHGNKRASDPIPYFAQVDAQILLGCPFIKQVAINIGHRSERNIRII